MRRPSILLPTVLSVFLSLGCSGSDSDDAKGAGAAGSGGASGGSGGIGSAGFPSGGNAGVGANSGGNAGSASGGAGNAAGAGGAGGAAGAGGSGGAGGSSGTGGATASCPASSVVNLPQWTTSPWVAPSTGTAETVFKLSKETWKHYERLDLDLEFDVKSLEVPYVCFLELRNTGANQSAPYPWRYFSVCFKNGPYNGNNNKTLIYVAYDAVKYEYLVQTYTLKNNTSYKLNIVWDAKALQSTLTLTPAGGAPLKLTRNPITSSIVPQGQGLDLLVGFNTNHPDYKKGIIKPPWGWGFRNLNVKLTPGGPYGSEAPPCK